MNSKKRNFADIVFAILMVILVVGIFIALCFLHPSIANASCSRDLNELKPEMRRKVNELKKRAKTQGVDCRIICGYRTQKAQLELYAQGRNKAGKKVTWTKRSKHTSRIAVDVVRIKGGRISWVSSDYFALGKIGKSLGLIWGGDWKQRDYGHFELRQRR